VIDTLGFHTDRDYHEELTEIRKEINALTGRVAMDVFHSWEARHNTTARLVDLHAQAAVLTREAAMEDQRIQRLADAVRVVGDADLGFITYVVFGPNALPLTPLYEVRLVDPDGYTVPGTVRTNLPADRIDRAKQQLMTAEGPAYARERGLRFTGYRVQVTPF
jgi:hypothetical protein